MKTELSIIIPVAPGEQLQCKLMKQLFSLPDHWEVLICSDHKPDNRILANENFRWIPCSGGRAASLNEGAGQSRGEYLWFLHADSVLVRRTFPKLKEIMWLRERALYYFDLKFIRLSSHNVRPKEMGVLFRSRILKTPFGDQGFLMLRDLFEQFGPYSTIAAYGEDHLFVRKLRRNRIKLVPIGMALYTSPRKYEQGGWIRITLLHQYLWLKQVLEDWWLNRR